MAQPLPNPNPILPDNPEYLPIHTRNYEVRAFKVNDNEILLWGAVRDDKPAGMYVQNDDEALTKSFRITSAPESASNTRASLAYQSLVGSPTRFVNCSAAHVVARTPLRCCRRWDRLPFNVAGACASSK